LVSDALFELLVEFADLLCPLAQLAEQPSVLDGDDRLRGEVFDQFDLLFRENAWLLTTNIERANRLVVLY
jgi:hypothetical protein